MLETTHIRQHINRDVFDYQQLTDCLASLRKPRDKIRRLLAKGDIIRIKKGLYVFGEVFRRGPLCRELLANLIYGPSYISLDYALSHYGLIPERVETVTSVTTGRSRKFDTPFGMFSYRHLSTTRYAPGVFLEQSGEDSYLIASPEKALADKIWVDKRIGGAQWIDYGSYLFQDLRLDRDCLITLDTNRLTDIANAYGSRKIDLLLRFLQSLREQSDE